jgi:hypothetical protein
MKYVSVSSMTFGLMRDTGPFAAGVGAAGAAAAAGFPDEEQAAAPASATAAAMKRRDRLFTKPP